MTSLTLNHLICKVIETCKMKKQLHFETEHGKTDKMASMPAITNTLEQRGRSPFP